MHSLSSGDNFSSTEPYFFEDVGVDFVELAGRLLFRFVLLLGSEEDNGHHSQNASRNDVNTSHR